MVSSWCGPGFEGTTTASGEIYRAYARGGPSQPAVRHEATRQLRGKADDCGVTDWGPYAGDRDLDLSQAAKEVGLNAVDAEEVDVRVVASSVGYVSTTSKSHEGKDREGDAILVNAALQLECPYLRILGTSSTLYSKL